MGKSRFLTGKVIVAIASLPAIIAVGVALGIGNAWAFGDGSSTMTTYLTTPVPVDKSAMTRSVSGMGDELAVEVEGEGYLEEFNILLRVQTSRCRMGS